MGINCITVSYGHQGRNFLERYNAFVVDNVKEIEKYIFDNRTVDFHTHSTLSDGTMTPTELVNYAKWKGLSAVALTDHDSVDGIKEASLAAEKAEIEFIPGIEFSAADETETHIVGLFIDAQNEELLKTVEALRSSRKKRMEIIISKLRAMGFEVTYDEALSLAGSDFLGRAHIAHLMVKKGYCKTASECFDKYIGFGKPAYAEKNTLSAEDAIRAINNAGGLSFLAHLHQTKYNIPQLRKLLTRLKDAGLTGIEGYYTEYTPEHISQYRALATEMGLIISGGSDFHGEIKPDIEIGEGTGELKIPYYILENLKNKKIKND